MVREVSLSLKFNFIECIIVYSRVRQLPLLKQQRNIGPKVTLTQSFKQPDPWLKAWRKRNKTEKSAVLDTCKLEYKCNKLRWKA